MSLVIAQSEVVSVTTASQFLDVVAGNLTAAEIAADLLKLDQEDSILQICQKIEKAVKENPEHLTEIILGGLTAIAFGCDTREEMLSSAVFAFGVADKAALAH